MPPKEVWGFEVGDRIEFRVRRIDPWQLGNVVILTKDRNVIVQSDEALDDKGSRRHEVSLPSEIRLWKPPSTTDDIEAFLNGR